MRKMSTLLFKTLVLMLVIIMALTSCSAIDSLLGVTPPDTPNEEATPCGHYVTTQEGKREATCSEAGYTGDKVCYSCKEVIKKGSVIEKLPHTYKDGKCSVCGVSDPDFTGSVTGPFDYSKVPEYSGEHYVVINGNTPYFDDNDITDVSFETYSDLDSLGRATLAYACLGRDLMPTGQRPSISYNPTGWKQNSYPTNVVPQTQIYNRSHLIAWALAGEGNNKNNLITGTPYFNQLGMQIFENQVLDYIKETGNHVMYRVTPVYVGNELVARGVLMEGRSVEDNGDGICFCVFMYNVQPGVVIDYATGENYLEKNDSDENTNIATLVTNINDLKAGDKIIIVAANANYALGESSSSGNNMVAIAIEKSGNTVSFGSDVQIITIGNGRSAGSYSLGVNGGYLFSASSSKNHLKTESSLSDNSSWKIEISASGIATVKSQGSNSRNWLRYNDQNVIFSSYGSGQQDILIYIVNET